VFLLYWKKSQEAILSDRACQAGGCAPRAKSVVFAAWTVT
jgi:hypothetical protein